MFHSPSDTLWNCDCHVPGLRIRGPQRSKLCGDRPLRRLRGIVSFGRHNDRILCSHSPTTPLECHRMFAAQKLWERGTPFRRLIVLEPTLFDRSIERIFAGVEKRAKKGYLKRATHWSDVEEAMRYHRDKHPWDTWDPEVLELMKVSASRCRGSGMINRLWYPVICL